MLVLVCVKRSDSLISVSIVCVEHSDSFISYYIHLQGIFRENFLMLYCCKDYKNVSSDKKFLQNKFFACFAGFGSST